jgi:phage-related protein
MWMLPFLLRYKVERLNMLNRLWDSQGASVLEIVERDRSGTYRCVYTVKFQTAVYVLHAFQKKSHKGIATPKEDIEMIKRRFKLAAETDTEVIVREKKGNRK